MPSDTLVQDERLGRLGIAGRHALFGGVVPYPFVLTKVITHPLIDAAAPRAAGLVLRFRRPGGRRGAPGLLRLHAGGRAPCRHAACWRSGPVRVKPVRATGGRGQQVVRDADALAQCLAAMDAAEIVQHGLVLEENLESP